MAEELTVTESIGDSDTLPDNPLTRDRRSVLTHGVADPLVDTDSWLYRATRSRWYAYICEAERSDLERITPNPLNIVDDTVEIWYCDHSMTTVGSYYEFGVTIACEYEDYKGGYCPYMFTTQDAATFAGRQIGFPKKMAYIVARELDDGPSKEAHKKDYFSNMISRNGYVIHTSSGRYDDAEVDRPLYHGDSDWGRFNMRVDTSPDFRETTWQLTYLDSKWNGAHRFDLYADTIRTASPEEINSWFLQATPFDNLGAMIPPKEVRGMISFDFDLVIPPAEVIWSDTIERTEDEVAELQYSDPYRYGLRQRFAKPRGV